MHTSLHSISPSSQGLGEMHWPCSQLASCSQALPQLPQFSTSVNRSAQLPPQSTSGASQPSPASVSVSLTPPVAPVSVLAASDPVSVDVLVLVLVPVSLPAWLSLAVGLLSLPQPSVIESSRVVNADNTWLDMAPIPSRPA